MNIEKIITSFLSPYNKQSRFLKTFRLEGIKGIASFEIDSKFYCQTNQPIHYFTATEMQICLNQLLYVYYASLKLIPVYEGIELSTDFVKEMDDNYFIIEQNSKFKRKIEVSKAITAEIRLTKTKEIGTLLYTECDFDFEKGCFGSVKLVIKK